MKFYNTLLSVSFVTGAFSKITSEVNDIFNQVKEQRVLVQFNTPELPTINFSPNSRVDANLAVLNLVDNLSKQAKEAQIDAMSIINKYKSMGLVKDIKSYSISNTLALTATKEVLDKLAKLKDVVEISANQPFKLKLPNPEVSDRAGAAWDGSSPHWSLTFINATNISQSVKDAAAKLVYANADTGVEFKHEALIANYRGKKGSTYDHNYNWYDTSEKKTGSGTLSPVDDNSHGTHTMSTTVGGKNLGVSPTTPWIACKNMKNDLGSPETYLGCLQFLMAPTDLNGKNPKPELRPHVIGNSYGCPTSEGCSRTTFANALKSLKAAGIFMSVSAGNDGAGGCSSMLSPPAIDPNAFSVASSGYKTLTRSSFSSMGPVPERKIALDVTAPGSSITGAVPGNTYGVKSGTSMASPHVSGAALLIMAACPNLERNVDLVAKVLRDSATRVYSTRKCGDDLSTSLPNNEYGYGVINVAKALALCKTIS